MPPPRRASRSRDPVVICAADEAQHRARGGGAGAHCLHDLCALLAQLGAREEVGGLHGLGRLLDLVDLGFGEALDLEELARGGEHDVLRRRRARSESATRAESRAGARGEQSAESDLGGVDAGLLELLDVGGGDALLGEHVDLARAVGAREASKGAPEAKGVEQQQQRKRATRRCCSRRTLCHSSASSSSSWPAACCCCCATDILVLVLWLLVLKAERA